MTSGLEVLVHEVIAAITTAPWLRLNFSPVKFTSADLLTSLVNSGSTC